MERLIKYTLFFLSAAVAGLFLAPFVEALFGTGDEDFSQGGRLLSFIAVYVGIPILLFFVLLSKLIKGFDNYKNPAFISKVE